MNAKWVKDSIVSWIRDYFERNGDGCAAVVGISGGKDSTVVAALCAEALGRERVLGVMMPQGEQPDIGDSYRVVEALGIPHVEINIGPVVDAHLAELDKKIRLTDQTKINLPCRIRMATLYAVAQSLLGGGRVANTCNYSEDYIGYSTKFGDSAGDFAPISQFLMHEVKELGYLYPEIPRDLIDKTPSDGVCGLTDEDNFGFTYYQLDSRLSTGTSGDEAIDKKIAWMHERNLHKLEPMPHPQFELRPYLWHPWEVADND